MRGALGVLPLARGSRVLLEVDTVQIGGIAHRVAGCEPFGDGFVLALEDVTDRDAAAALRGQLVEVPRAAISLDPGEYLVADLIGLAAVDPAGAALGTIAEILQLPAHDVLVIRDGDRERLVPLVDAFLREVDLPGGRVVLDPPEEED